VATDEQRVSQLCDELLEKLDPKTTPPAEFLGAQYDLGLAWVHFAEGFAQFRGGRALFIGRQLARGVLQIFFQLAQIFREALAVVGKFFAIGRSALRASLDNPSWSRTGQAART